MMTMNLDQPPYLGSLKMHSKKMDNGRVKNKRWLEELSHNENQRSNLSLIALLKKSIRFAPPSSPNPLGFSSYRSHLIEDEAKGISMDDYDTPAACSSLR